MKSSLGRGNLPARGFEGVTLAISAVRANKTRASLTILGIAIGVMVVIAMASAITGIQNSVSAIVERAGPKTFYVMRYFQAGIQVSAAPTRSRHVRKLAGSCRATRPSRFAVSRMSPT